MADARGCELARPLISELQVEANGIEVHLLGGEIWKLPRGLLSRSLVLRKLAEWSEDRGCFLLRPRCASTLGSLRIALDWPRSPAEVLKWLMACDFLLVSPKDSELIFVVTSALDVWLTDVDAALADCSTSEALQASRRLATYGSLELFLRSPSLVWQGGYDGDDGYDPPSVAASERATTWPWIKSLRCDAAADGGLAVLDLLPCLRRKQDSEHLRFHGALECVEKTLFALSNTMRGSRRLLEHVALVKATFGYRTARHLVHRCLCCLYLAESLGETEGCAISAETCRSLQELYHHGGIDLRSLLPIRDRAALVLPGLPGAREVHMLEPTAAAIFAVACAKVPWLQAAMTFHATLHLTGSFLCWCRSPEASRRVPLPSDVDLFCTAVEDLDPATEHVRVCMLDFARSLWTSASVEASAPNAHRRTLSITFGQPPDPASQAAPPRPYLLHCDVYVNSLAKVMKYHLPQVRCALYLANAQPQLFMAPSAAIAWITMLNIDYCAIKGSKTPFEIIGKAWLWGFNLCLSRKEVGLLRTYLRMSHPMSYIEAELLHRPTRIVPHACEHGYPWLPFMDPEEMSVEP